MVWIRGVAMPLTKNRGEYRRSHVAAVVAMIQWERWSPSRWFQNRDWESRRVSPLPRGRCGGNDSVGATVPVAMPLIPTPLWKRGVRGDLMVWIRGVAMPLTKNRGEHRRSHERRRGGLGQGLKIHFEGIFANDYRSETIR